MLSRLEALADPQRVEAMPRFGVRAQRAFGVSVPALRKLAREFRYEHALAQRLWDTGIHEARALAAMIDDPALVTEEQLERWAADFSSWDICDCCCGDLFWRTPFAYPKALEWARRDEEYVKRAGFSLMAALAREDKRAPDARIAEFLPAIAAAANDERNFVKKAVSWALREVGKRSPALNSQAIATAQQLRQRASRSARWIATDALRELTGEAVQGRLRARTGP